jgi:hypothetical protein
MTLKYQSNHIKSKISVHYTRTNLYLLFFGGNVYKNEIENVSKKCQTKVENVL